MNLKKIKSVTPSQRCLIQLNNEFLNKSYLLKSNVTKIKKSTGRDKNGTIVSYHKGGGHKKRYRIIDFCRTNVSTGIVLSLEYDPMRNGFIGAIYDFLNKSFYYILAPKGLKIGDIVKSGLSAEQNLGHSLPLNNVIAGSCIYNVSTNNNKKSTISRAAGTYSKLIEKTSSYGKIKLSSGAYKYVKLNNYVTIGVVSNEFFSVTTLGKAGRSRWLNNRPKVRGVAMNPVDHPHGGGEGKTSGGKSSVTPWGNPTKNGKKTSNSLKIYYKD